MKEYISLSHGSGGAMTQQLIREIFTSAFDNIYLRKLDDASVVELCRGRYAMTTDSFVVDPIFFPGGDIGKLAVCGLSTIWRPVPPNQVSFGFFCDRRRIASCCSGVRCFLYGAGSQTATRIDYHRGYESRASRQGRQAFY
jgi:hypothetical protein